MPRSSIEMQLQGCMYGKPRRQPTNRQASGSLSRLESRCTVPLWLPCLTTRQQSQVLVQPCISWFKSTSTLAQPGIGATMFLRVPHMHILFSLGLFKADLKVHALAMGNSSPVDTYMGALVARNNIIETAVTEAEGGWQYCQSRARGPRVGQFDGSGGS
ncbi:hypothetical protein C8Q72DRAFT_857341 [Fomitopsis betulina]|nr:hypothetical protein C8Q72DRAFT_857341 [Fomitopsis betulina]